MESAQSISSRMQNRGDKRICPDENGEKAVFARGFIRATIDRFLLFYSLWISDYSACARSIL